MAVRGALWAGVVAALIAAPAARAEVTYSESPRSGALKLKLGGYTPNIGDPYLDYFGDASMLLFAIDYDRYFWKGFGSFGVGLSAGYAEKYGRATEATAPGATGEAAVTAVPTGLHVVPLKLTALYNFDYLANEMNIPLVPYVKGGLAFVPWWTTKGEEVESRDGIPLQGASFGLAGVAGIAFQLDVLGQRMARDMDSEFGINHTYIFAEYNLLQADSFGRKLNLSDNYWMFGMAFEF